MTIARIEEFEDHVGGEVSVRGWIHNKRSSGKLQFLILRDGSGYAQAVVSKKAVTPEAWDALEKAGQESSLELRGTVRADSRAPGGFELDVTQVSLLQAVHDYPITPKEHGTAFLMENRHLWLRSSQQRAILRVRNEIEKAIVDFFYDRGFVRLDSPILTGADALGAQDLRNCLDPRGRYSGWALLAWLHQFAIGHGRLAV